LIGCIDDGQRIDAEKELPQQPECNCANSTACDPDSTHAAPVFDAAIPIAAFPTHFALRIRCPENITRNHAITAHVMFFSRIPCSDVGVGGSPLPG